MLFCLALIYLLIVYGAKFLMWTVTSRAGSFVGSWLFGTTAAGLYGFAGICVMACTATVFSGDNFTGEDWFVGTWLGLSALCGLAWACIRANKRRSEAREMPARLARGNTESLAAGEAAEDPRILWVDANGVTHRPKFVIERRRKGHFF
jgi:hypothetical protein